MDPCHAETESPGGTGNYYTEGSRDTTLHVWFLVICCIGQSFMVQTIYDLTQRIEINIGPSHQSGEEQDKLGGSAQILLRAMSAHNRAENKK